MSADNWGICPKCKKTGEDKLKSSYGAIPEDEYLNLRMNLNKTLVENTLREDYDIYTDKNGEFVVSYGCSCERCGFSFRFDHSVNVLENKK